VNGFTPSSLETKMISCSTAAEGSSVISFCDGEPTGRDARLIFVGQARKVSRVPMVLSFVRPIGNARHMCAARSPLTAFNSSRSHAEIAGEPRTPVISDHDANRPVIKVR